MNGVGRTPRVITETCVAGCRVQCCTGLGRAAVCLAIPGKIPEIQEPGPIPADRVHLGQIVCQVSLSSVPEAGLRDYVMVHVGFAISRVDSKGNWRRPSHRLAQQRGTACF